MIHQTTKTGNINQFYYRSLQERVDKLEAEKESLVNHYFDIRKLLQLISAEGETQVNQVKARNAALETRLAQLI